MLVEHPGPPTNGIKLLSTASKHISKIYIKANQAYHCSSLTTGEVEMVVGGWEEDSGRILWSACLSCVCDYMCVYVTGRGCDCDSTVCVCDV